MVGFGLPNDTIKSLNPISIVIFAPLVQRVLYPYLTRHRIGFQPIARITVGFGLLAVSMAITTGVQLAIYSAGPCYDQPLNCPAADGGRIPNQVSIFLQVPIYVVGGVAEIFCYVTGMEYAYNQAPKSMRSIVQAYWLAMAGFGSALSIALTPLAKDPHFVTMYGVLTGAMAGTTILFWVLFRRSNKKAMDML
jgi:POT family proton-dependent oligopeptide transporter